MSDIRSGIDLLVIGELNADVVVDCGDRPPAFGQAEDLVEDATLVLGSSGAITACAAARLGLRVALAAAVGDDWLGGFCLERLAERGVDTTPCVRRGRTGMTVALGVGGDRSMLTYLGATGRLSAGEIDPAYLDAARHVHVGSYFLHRALWPGLPGLFAAARARGATTSLDPNFDPARTWDSGLRTVLPHTDYVLPNDQEARAITGMPDAARAAAALATGPTAVVKCGADGAVWRPPGGAALRVAAPEITAVETTGAGDTFDAGLLAALLDGAPPEDALRLAAACGALATRAAGGTASQPTRAEAEELARHLPPARPIAAPSTTPGRGTP